MIKLAINGFGRIGRLAFRIALEYPEQIRVVAINTSGKMDVAGWAYLLQYDTAYGKYEKKIKVEKEGFTIENVHYPIFGERNPAKLPWKKYNVDVVLESTGVFRDYENASQHLKAGAKKVLISAPAKSDNIPTYLMGVNLTKYQGEKIIDGASCTTNAAAPVLKVVLENFGIKSAFLTTVHAYTGDQRLQDGSHRDLRRARAASENIIPTSTGASKATIKAIPELAGKLEGLAIRVPTLVGSLIDLVVALEKNVNADEINQVFIKAGSSNLKGILGTTNEPLVSSDIIGSSYSAVVDLSLTKVIDGNLAKIVVWYDNEWTASKRLIETAIYIGERG
ncbi:type I glyceraldehyde-3-phosphate dehydrogenase [Candidatus Microgenomates bacterium]|nr:type I glyceraldehyde-3-phosphate dehydrogenase [Candidatus Microgenomates bacterium]